MHIADGWDVAHLVMHTAFDELGLAGRHAQVGPIDPDAIDPIQCFHVGGRVDLAQGTSRRHLVKAVTLYQAGMESTISYWISRHSGLSTAGGFVERWDNVCGAKGCAPGLGDYAIFYREIRNAIVHPDTDARVRTIQTLRVKRVHEGIADGWSALQRLASALGEPHDADSWKIMCEAHGVPLQCSDELYPDLLDLRARLYKRHLDHLNAGLVGGDAA